MRIRVGSFEAPRVNTYHNFCLLLSKVGPFLPWLFFVTKQNAPGPEPNFGAYYKQNSQGKNRLTLDINWLLTSFACVILYKSVYPQ